MRHVFRAWQGVMVLLASNLLVFVGASLAQDTPGASRPKPRPTLSDEQYTQQAKDLREKYTKPADQWPTPTIDPGIEAQYKEIGPLPDVTFPADNPSSPEKIELGKMLFFDPRLSGSKQVACASCHDPDLGWGDGRTVAFGHERQTTKRNAPSILNSAYHTSLFWDGRAKSLEEQAIAPILNEGEMHGKPEEVVSIVGGLKEYRERFKAVFKTEEVSMELIGKAIATFERTINGGRSRFDQFVTGKRTDALSDAAIRGLHLFRTDARCANCHMGPNFSDDKFHDVGLSYYGRPFEDLGLYHITKNPEDVGKFRTPSLRNVTRTGPYMHNGLFELDGVINLYNSGMPNLKRKAGQENDPLFPTKSPHLRVLNLNEHDKDDLKAFLEALEEPRLRVRPPTLPGLAPAKTDAAARDE
jgi:cytochrome c peroxidase